MNKIMLGLCIIMVVMAVVDQNMEAFAGWFAAMCFLYQLNEKT